MAPSSSQWSGAAPRGTLVPEGSEPEAPESSMLQVLEVSARLVQDGSHATLLQDELVQEESDADVDGVSLGVVNVEVDGDRPSARR
jgi:hypothetical protein